MFPPPSFFFSFQLRTLLAADLLRVKDDIEDICDSADKQMAIDTKLSEVRGKWSSACFTFEQYKGKGKVYLLKGYGQIIEDLEESQLALQTMLSMRHVGPVRVIGLYDTCWWYSLCHLEYRQHYEQTCSYNFDC